MAYIYKITNDINNKIYIGKTEFSVEKRWKEHCRDSQKENKQNRPLYRAMKKYGLNHFHIEVIEKTDRGEEREKYWIEYYGSFKKGYNATLGGDGKPYIDRELVIQNYRQLHSLVKVAELMNISTDSVSAILKMNDIPVKSGTEVMKEQYGKVVSAYTKQNEFIKSFSSYSDAAQWLIDNNLTGCKKTTIRTHISEVVRGKRKSAAGFIWK
jgi:group I intron endonuclease